MDQEGILMQRQQRHATGTFPACRDCGAEPRHILDHRCRPLGGHLMSRRCGDTTKHDDLAGALSAWRMLHAPALLADGARIVRLIQRGGRSA